jgi:hypothetical protein
MQMCDNVVEDRKAATSMMWSVESGGMGKSITALIETVVQTNLQAMQELLRAENPQDLLKLQQRFTCDYMTVPMRGTMALVDAQAAGYAGAALPASPRTAA